MPCTYDMLDQVAPPPNLTHNLALTTLIQSMPSWRNMEGNEDTVAILLLNVSLAPASQRS